MAFQIPIPVLRSGEYPLCLGTRKMKFYITTAIDYPNSLPHMGHAYEKVVTDFYARWYRLRGADVRFLTGLDEHGEKIQEAARVQGKSPQAFVDERSLVFRDLCRRLSISIDDFIRTSEPRHHRFVTDLFRKMAEKGDTYKGFYEGEYCVGCEAFYTETQLVEGRCSVHGTPTARLKEESYFFRLGKYRDWIRDHIRSHPGFVYPPERRNEILSRLEDEVRDLSISRCTFDWGIQVPGDPRHVIYVWFDALSNYASALKEPQDLSDRFWPADVHVVGKDIIWFHAVIWPCMLRSAGIPIPEQVYAHGFILDREGRKMSKTLGNVVDPLEVAAKYGSDVLRYYFLRAFSSGQDGWFSLDELRERYTNELANDLGNLVMRVSKLVATKLEGSAGPCGAPADLDFREVIEEFSARADSREHHRAMDALWNYIRRANAYLTEKAPWKIDGRERLAPILYNALEALRAIAHLASPAMPDVAAAISSSLGFAIGKIGDLRFGTGTFRVTQRPPLFPKLEEAAGEAPPAGTPAPKPSEKVAKSEAVPKPQAQTADPFARLEIRIGIIVEVGEHPDADSLYILKVDLGTETRPLCAGLRKHLSMDDLRGKKVAVLANLKPAKLRGIESRGMVLATDRRDGKVVPVDPGSAAVGELVTVSGIEAAPKAKLSMDEFQKAPLLMQGGRVVYRDPSGSPRPLLTKAGEIRCDAEDGAIVR